MKKIFTLLLIVTLSLISSLSFGADAPIPPKEKDGWILTFNDDFNYPVLNDAYWFPSNRTGRAVFKAKQNGYFISAESITPVYKIEDGVLKLRINRPTNNHWGKVSQIGTSDFRVDPETKECQIMDKFAQKYGWWEIRCRMPKGSGLHSAFWLLQSNPYGQEYELGGARKKIGDGVFEIDIFEQLGNKIDERLNYFNVHFTKTGAYKHKYDFDASKEFHIWALEWNEGELNWYLDGEKIHTYKGETPQEKMHILLGLYMGSDWVGAVDKDMPFPRDFEIDYIRVYKKSPTPPAESK